MARAALSLLPQYPEPTGSPVSNIHLVNASNDDGITETPTDKIRKAYQAEVREAIAKHGTANIDYLKKDGQGVGTHKMRKVHPFGPDIIKEQKIDPSKVHGVLAEDISAEKRAAELRELALWLQDIRGNLRRQNEAIRIGFAKGKPLGGRLMD